MLAAILALESVVGECPMKTLERTFWTILVAALAATALALILSRGRLRAENYRLIDEIDLTWTTRVHDCGLQVLNLEARIAELEGE